MHNNWWALNHGSCSSGASFGYCSRVHIGRYTVHFDELPTSAHNPCHHISNDNCYLFGSQIVKNRLKVSSSHPSTVFPNFHIIIVLGFHRSPYKLHGTFEVPPCVQGSAPRKSISKPEQRRQRHEFQEDQTPWKTIFWGWLKIDIHPKRLKKGTVSFKQRLWIGLWALKITSSTAAALAFAVYISNYHLFGFQTLWHLELVNVINLSMAFRGIWFPNFAQQYLVGRNMNMNFAVV